MKEMHFWTFTFIIQSNLGFGVTLLFTVSELHLFLCFLGIIHAPVIGNKRAKFIVGR